jgi:hypothetical protein
MSGEETTMQHLDLILDAATLRLLDRLADRYYGGSRFRALQAAVESLAVHVHQGGWTLVGYEAVVEPAGAGEPPPEDPVATAEIRFRPVFARGAAVPTLTAAAGRPPV